MVKVTDRFYIIANSNCYTLQEKTKVQDVKSKNYGKEIFKDSRLLHNNRKLFKRNFKNNYKRIYKQRRRKQYL